MSVPRGIALLARFDRAGLAEFDASPRGLLNALAPWLAFALVAALLLVIEGDAPQAIADLLASVVALLAPPVTSHALARLWRREAAWLRYAVSLAWCQWVMPPALLVALCGSFLLIASGLPERSAERLAMGGLLLYALALNVFLARRALDLSVWRAVATMLAINLATVAAVVAPGLLAMLARGVA